MTLVTAADVEKFRRDGYLICHKQLFPAPKLLKLQNTFESILARKPADKRPEDIDVPCEANGHRRPPLQQDFFSRSSGNRMRTFVLSFAFFRVFRGLSHFGI